MTNLVFGSASFYWAEKSLRWGGWRRPQFESRDGKELFELEALTDLPQLGPILSCSKLFRN